MRGDLLFWKHDWFSVVEGQKAALRKHVDGLRSDFFESGPLDELADQLATKFSLVPPVIEPDKIEVSQREVDIDVSGDSYRDISRSGPHYVKGTAITVNIPFTGDKGMFLVRPSTFSTHVPHGNVRDGFIQFTISGTKLTTEKVKSDIDSTVKSISEFLKNQALSVGNFPQEIRQIAYQALEQRKLKLDADKDLTSNLGYKVK
jgi:hypothetical protein